MELEKIFTEIYLSNKWNMGQNESKSGLGSTLNYTESIRINLVKIIKEYNITNIIDTSCGDWHWMKSIKYELGCKYTGIDIVKDIIDINTKTYSTESIKFIHGDFLSIIKILPDNSIDLILCRHTLEHLATEYNLDFIKECKRVTKYLLLTTKKISETLPINKELNEKESYRPINLELTPYEELLNKYKIKKIYDGPSDIIDNEMGICLYKF